MFYIVAYSIASILQLVFGTMSYCGHHNIAISALGEPGVLSAVASQALAPLLACFLFAWIGSLLAAKEKRRERCFTIFAVLVLLVIVSELL